MDDRITKLDRLAEHIHKGQVDKRGIAYIWHLRGVADAVSDPAKPVALLHDAIEDERISRDQLAELLTRDELAAVELLTHDKRHSYAEYIDRINAAAGVAGELAREVKLADLGHNLGRMTAQTERLRPRYEKALRQLSSA